MTHIHPGRLLKAFIEAIWNFPEAIFFAHMVYFLLLAIPCTA